MAWAARRRENARASRPKAQVGPGRTDEKSSSEECHYAERKEGGRSEVVRGFEWLASKVTSGGLSDAGCCSFGCSEVVEETRRKRKEVLCLHRHTHSMNQRAIKSTFRPRLFYRLSYIAGCSVQLSIRRSKDNLGKLYARLRSSQRIGKPRRPGGD
jgi:hypothetical protein